MIDIEKLHQILSSLWKNDDNVGKIYYNQALQDVQIAIDSLQKEPVSEDIVSVAKQYVDSHVFGNEEDKFARSVLIDMFCSGAQWKKQQDQSTIELAEDHAMLAGMEKMKEQMMKEAIDGYVIEDIEEGNGDFLLSCEYLPKNMGLVDKQKVKVIIIKED